MTPHVLDQDEILQLLATTRSGRLLTLDTERDEPYLVPVSFVLLARSIYFYTEPGRKLTTLRAHPESAALQIDRNDQYAAWSVLASGTYVPVSRSRERSIATAGLLTKYRQTAVAPIWARSQGHWRLFLQNLSRAEMGAIRLARLSGRRWD